MSKKHSKKYGKSSKMVPEWIPKSVPKLPSVSNLAPKVTLREPKSAFRKNVKKLMPQKRLRPQNPVGTRPQSSPKPPPNLAALAVGTSRLPAAASGTYMEYTRGIHT